MTKTCKSILFSLGLLLTINGWCFIFKIDHYGNKDGQHIFLFSDRHINYEDTKSKELSNNKQRCDIVKAAAKNEAFVITEDQLILGSDGPQQMYQDLLKGPKTFDRNKDYSAYFDETFFTQICPNSIPL